MQKALYLSEKSKVQVCSLTEKQKLLVVGDHSKFLTTKDDSNRFEIKSESEFGEDKHAVFLDGLIDRLMKSPLKRKKETRRKGRGIAPLVNAKLTETEIYRVCKLASDSLLKQPSLLVLKRENLPLTIVGDIHGQLKELRYILHACGPPEDMNYLFLGDYVDRGPQGVETLALLLALKVRYPNRVFLLRGNHEDFNTSIIYGFYDECARKFPRDLNQNVYQSFVHAFNCLPFAALICDKVFAMHGGISPDLRSPADVNSIQRPTFIPLAGLATDLVWSDPMSPKEGWAQNPRGISYIFDDSIIDKFCDKNGIDYIVRGHQVNNSMTNSGHFFTPNGKLVTLFSAFNYLNSGNTGGVLQLMAKDNAKIGGQFLLFRPSNKKGPVNGTPRRGTSLTKKRGN
uniref:Serine/threonine-protein phosphatase n=1 Tax=Panagrolaimus sp. JU765 TaxID=591449 RepID=A0AC34RI93_9BILA